MSRLGLDMYDLVTASGSGSGDDLSTESGQLRRLSAALKGRVAESVQQGGIASESILLTTQRARSAATTTTTETGLRLGDAKVGALRAADRIRPRVPEHRITKVDKWLGRVVEIGDDYFVGELTHVNGSPEPVLADFNLFDDAEVEASVEVGDVFYVTSRSEKTRFGTRQSASAVRFRRLGYWTIEESEEIYDRARAAAAALIIDDVTTLAQVGEPNEPGAPVD